MILKVMEEPRGTRMRGVTVRTTKESRCQTIIAEVYRTHIDNATNEAGGSMVVFLLGNFIVDKNNLWSQLGRNFT